MLSMGKESREWISTMVRNAEPARAKVVNALAANAIVCAPPWFSLLDMTFSLSRFIATPDQALNVLLLAETNSHRPLELAC